MTTAEYDDVIETVSTLFRAALASGIAHQEKNEENLRTIEDDGVWVAGQTIDTSAATDSLYRLLSYEPFLRSLAQHTKYMTWVNVYQRCDANSPPQDELDLRDHLGAELWQGLTDLAETIVALPEEGPLAAGEWELESFGFVLGAPGTPRQGLHIDYDQYQYVGMVQLNGHIDPHATTQYLLVEGGDDVKKKSIERGSAKAGGYVDLDDLLFDASVGVEPESELRPVRVTVKRGPRQPHRPYILKAGTLHRGSGNPENAEYRIVFTVTFVPKGTPTTGREAIWEMHEVY
jgi:hypothetical protein